MQRSILSVNEIGSSFPRILDGLASKNEPTYITDDDGRARAVLLNIDKYHAMMDALENGDELEPGSRDAEVAGALVKAILERARKA